jgi:hypothetical protein
MDKRRDRINYLVTSDNSGHTATLRFAQTQPYGGPSHVRETLVAIVALMSQNINIGLNHYTNKEE